MIIIYVNLGGQLFNKTSFVEKLELFFGLGFMVDCYDWFWLGCMWLIVMKCLCWGVCG